MNTNRLTKALLAFLVVGILLPAIASAAPSLVPSPKHNIVGDKVNITITGADLTETGGQIAVWDTIAAPNVVIHPLQNCSSFPGTAGGTKWILTGSGGATVTYTILLGGTISIVSFGLNGGPGEIVSVTTTGGTTITPGPYQWTQVGDGVGTDNTNAQGTYLAATCGEESPGVLAYQASDTFETETVITQLTKAASSPKVENGSTVTYTFTENNTGTTDITNYSLVDSLCPTPLTTPVSGDINPADGNLSKGETWPHDISPEEKEEESQIAAEEPTKEQFEASLQRY